VFLLVDEGTVKKYKADLSDEIEPQITELISRAEKGMEALQKKRLLLQTKVTGVPPIIMYRDAISTKRFGIRSRRLNRSHNLFLLRQMG